MTRMTGTDCAVMCNLTNTHSGDGNESSSGDGNGKEDGNRDGNEDRNGEGGGVAKKRKKLNMNCRRDQALHSARVVISADRG